MITAIITAVNDAPRLGATLSTLAPAALDDLVREVIIADGGSTDATQDVADEVGAKVISGRRDRVLAEACAAARQPWLLILPAGARLQVGWEAVVRGHIRRRPAAGAWFKLSLAEGGIAARLEEAWADGAARWLGRRRPDQGLLIAARQWSDPRATAHGLRTRILIGGH